MNNFEDIDSRFAIRDNKPQIDIRAVLMKYLYHWPVFLVGLIICLGFAYVYLRYAEPVYSVNSVLLIKDDRKNASAGSGDLLNDLDLFGSSKVIDNEIEILKSKTLMRKVVDRLNLTVEYKVEGRVRKRDLYSNKPIKLDIIEESTRWYGKTFEIEILDNHEYILKEEGSNESVQGKIGVLQRNGFGTYKVNNGSVPTKKIPTRKLSITFLDPEAVVDQYLSLLNVTLSTKQSTVLNLSLQTKVPEQGQDVLNTLVQVYNEAALSDKNITTQSTIQFIDERLGLITGELTEVEKDVEGFKSSRGLTDLSSDANLFLDNVKLNDAKLGEINLQLNVINDVNRYVNSSSGSERLPSTLGISDPVLLGQISQLSELQLERDQLLSTTTENNPLVEPLFKQIETIKSGIKSSLMNIKKSLEITKADLEGTSTKIQSSIKKIPGQERQLISIKRQQAIKESLYLYLLQKKEEAALSYASAVADSRIVDPAFYSKSPIKPKRATILMISMALGLVLPIVYIHTKGILNNKVEGIQDLRDRTSASIVGEILLSDETKPIVVEEKSRAAIAEQFRSLRTNMQFLHGKKVEGRGSVTLFTSGMSGEGKTFVATNLAAAFAISGKRTVLLELDLRKPKISKYLSIRNDVGLSNYLIGKASEQEIVAETTIHKNLFIIGSGPIPPNPSELLIQNDIDQLISQLRSNYDEIIIDSPPIGLVTDAQILSRVADATIYVVRQNVTFKDKLANLEDLIRSQKFPKLNVILNGITFGGAYGYGYGYGYGYYSDEVKKGTSISSIIKRF